MRLRIFTPLTLVIDQDGILGLGAEDMTGSFGIRPDHADFRTTLAIGVVGWLGADGRRHYCAVRRGVLSVSGGRLIEIATREAIPGDNLAKLDQLILSRFRADSEAERVEQITSTRLQLTAVRRIASRLRMNGRGIASGFS